MHEPQDVEAHLRASGGTDIGYHDNSFVGGASPRERRNLDPSDGIEDLIGRISARAEEPFARYGNARITAAHLRASGGTASRVLAK